MGVGRGGGGGGGGGHAPKGYCSCPVCLSVCLCVSVCPRELLCRLALAYNRRQWWLEEHIFSQNEKVFSVKLLR